MNTEEARKGETSVPYSKHGPVSSLLLTSFLFQPIYIYIYMYIYIKHCTDEAQKAETVLSAVSYIYSYFKKCCRGERRMSIVERRLND